MFYNIVDAHDSICSRHIAKIVAQNLFRTTILKRLGY